MQVDHEPSVSIALATYNGEKYIAEQLRSLAAQTRLPAELVVGDDGSTDRTLQIVEDFARTAPFPVRVVVNRRQLGYRENFVAIAGRCSSELISFCDQDDVWEPFKLARMIPCFDDAAVMLAYHNAAVTDAAGERKGRLYDAAVQQRNLACRPLYPWNLSSGFTQTMRAELTAFSDLWPLSADHFSDERQTHDAWFFFLALALGKVLFIDEELVRYRQHAANVLGAGEKRTLRVRVRDKLRRRAERDRQAAVAALQRAVVLDRIAERTTADRKRPLQEIGALYRRLSISHARRDRLYEQVGIPSRMAIFAQSVLKRDYGIGNYWRLDWREMPRDFVNGLFASKH